MAEKRPSEPVSFTRASADRIARAVRSVEQSGRGATPVVTAPRAVGGSSGVSIRKGSFTGSWNIGEYKTIEFCGSTQTASVLNATVNIYSDSGQNEVVFAKACGTHTLLSVELDQVRNIGGAIDKIAAYSGTAIQILGHDDEGALKWYSIVTCSTATTG